MTPWAWAARRRRAAGSGERGYVAIMVGLLLTVLLSFCAFAVDVGNWYFTGQRAQRAADAAALGGVPYLPGDPSSAYTTARDLAARNEFAVGTDTAVTPKVDGRPTRLRVTVSRTVKNQFGWMLGLDQTTITRSSVADYAGPVPMGSPCNGYGDDPYPDGHRSSNCNGTGQFWANVGSPQAPKSNGDAYQNSMGSNTDFDTNGYFYSVTVTKPVASLTIEAFDPALIAVGDKCDTNLSGADSLPAARTVVPDPATRYKAGATSGVCTGDVRFGGTGEVATQFTVRSPSVNQWDPLSYPTITGCQTTYAGFNGNLGNALDKASGSFNATVADNFRQWKQLCKITGGVTPGTYLIQVKTNGVGNDAASGHNRFSLRAYTESSSGDDGVAVAGYAKMAMYGNTPAGTSKFYLAKVPSGARGQLFTVRLFDIGDGATLGSTVKVLPPSEVGSSFSGCTGSGVQNGALTDCTINVSSAYNGQWQEVSVPIPTDYSCNDSSAVGCWLRLEFFYGAGSSPADTTSWTANVAGDPVRLVE
ncbi:pilus assembly protein TadG-related protein [Pedococcus soli]